MYAGSNTDMMAKEKEKKKKKKKQYIQKIR